MDIPSQYCKASIPPWRKYAIIQYWSARTCGGGSTASESTNEAMSQQEVNAVSRSNWLDEYTFSHRTIVWLGNGTKGHEDAIEVLHVLAGIKNRLQRNIIEVPWLNDASQWKGLEATAAGGFSGGVCKFFRSLLSLRISCFIAVQRVSDEIVFGLRYMRCCCTTNLPYSFRIWCLEFCLESAAIDAMVWKKGRVY